MQIGELCILSSSKFHYYTSNLMLQEWSLSGQGTMTTSGLAHQILLELFWRNLAGPSCINKNQQSYDL